MKITCNGAEADVAAADIAALLAELGLPADRVAVERNLVLVPRREWAATRLAPGDRIEVVEFVGGGLR